jgi:Zn-dependent peptidase ImmA (M78 family)
MMPRKKVRDEAAAVLSKFKVKTLPVAVDEIAVGLGAQLKYEPFDGNDDMSGMLFRDGEIIVIGINSAHSKTRQRFTIAHEIGHLVLHKGDLFVDRTVRLNRDGKSSLAIDDREIEANGFAAELLMPETLVTSGAQKYLVKNQKSSDIALLEHLAKVFQVSNHAMEIRLSNLGILSPR